MKRPGAGWPASIPARHRPQGNGSSVSLQQPDYDVWILLTVVSTVIMIILIFVVRTKCHWSRTQVRPSVWRQLRVMVFYKLKGSNGGVF